MLRHRGCVIVFLGTLLLTSFGCTERQNVNASATLQTAEQLRERLDPVLQPLIEDEWAVGMVVGVVTQSKAQVVSYGSVSRENESVPDGDSIFEIGSLTKAFTGMILAEMVERGEVKLSDPIGKYLPDEVSSPQHDGKEITLEELATHSAGFPLIADNFWPAGANRYDPNQAGDAWHAYSEEKIYEYLNDPKPPLGERGKYVYSNLGVGLLGHLLSRAAEKPYEELLRERILEPLGMDSTMIALSEEQQLRLVPGYDPDGQWVKPWKGSDLSGAFALRSTMNDLNTLMQTLLDLKETDLKSALALSQKAHFSKNEIEQVGLCWNLNKYGVVMHTGTTGGYRSALFLLPRLKIGVAILVNTQVGGASDDRGVIFEAVAGSLMNVLVGAPPLEYTFPKLDHDLEFAPADYVGTYLMGEDDEDGLKVEVRDGALWADVPGRTSQRVYPAAKDWFFMKAYDVELTFARDESGNITGAKVQLGKNSATLTKK